MNETETPEEPLEIRRTLSIETEATLGGLMNMLMRMPESIPHEAEIDEATTFVLCDDHAVGEEHEARERLVVNFSWTVAEDQP